MKQGSLELQEFHTQALKLKPWIFFLIEINTLMKNNIIYNYVYFNKRQSVWYDDFIFYCNKEQSIKDEKKKQILSKK